MLVDGAKVRAKGIGLACIMLSLKRLSNCVGDRVDVDAISYKKNKRNKGWKHTLNRLGFKQKSVFYIPLSLDCCVTPTVVVLVDGVQSKGVGLDRKLLPLKLLLNRKAGRDDVEPDAFGNRMSFRKM